AKTTVLGSEGVKLDFQGVGPVLKLQSFSSSSVLSLEGDGSLGSAVSRAKGFYYRLWIRGLV
ncbi:hypothetical protein U1Q18_033612, partial [Sarracenia purpurea var. burkii]